jgi:DNA-directed RNA polymerase specialized sigma24 family protein
MPVCETDRWYVPTPDNMTLLELWQQASPQLERLVRSMGLSSQVAEDILQEVYVTAEEKCPPHLGTDARRLWLIRVVVNRCRLEHRRQRRWSALLMRWSQFGSVATQEEVDVTERDEQRLSY